MLTPTPHPEFSPHIAPNPPLMQGKLFSNVFFHHFTGVKEVWGNSCTSIKHCPAAFPDRIKTDSLSFLSCTFDSRACRSFAELWKFVFSRMYLARCCREERPSGDPNTRQQRPPILTHQDIRFSEAGGKGHGAATACHHTLTHTHIGTHRVRVYVPSCWNTVHTAGNVNCDNTSRTLSSHDAHLTRNWDWMYCRATTTAYFYFWAIWWFFFYL